MPAPTPTCAIGVMAKAPRPGRSKTRLSPSLTPDDAAALSAAFLRDTTATIGVASRSAPITGFAAYAPAEAEAELPAFLAPGTRLVLADGSSAAPPGVEGFGRCLLQAIEGMLELGHPAACVLSSDVPTLPAGLLIEAAEILLAPGDRAVLGACDDGGYYLLGLKAAHARMFADISWSTGTVAEVTRERAREIGLHLFELAPWYDIDDAPSLVRLRGEACGSVAPHTASALARLGSDRSAAPAPAPAAAARATLP